ncbi:MAG: DUF2029 domain-containing protein [Cyanobacteria bacterium SZAS TMP-1]|nr:DUF2029 domain-containing protein [Cyanobacteria bacterium SZAS TMP-1]
MAERHELLVSASNGVISFSDFIRYYACGKIALSYDAHSCYDPVVQLKWFNKIIFESAGLLVSRPLITHYTPIVYPLAIPLALVSLSQAFSLWVLAGFAAVAAGFSLALNTAKKQPLWLSLLIVLGVAAAFPTIISLRMGQPSWFILALECVYLWAFVQKKHVVSGACVALLCFKPHYGLYFLVPLIIRKRYLAVGSFVVTLGLLLAAAGLIIGFDNLVNYPQFVVNTESNLGLLNYGGDKMVSLRFLASRFLTEAASVKVGLVVGFVGLFSAGTFWWRYRNTAVDGRWLIGCTVLICLLTSPHTYVYDLTMLGVLAVLLGENSIWRSRAGAGYYNIFQVLLVLYPIVTWFGIMLPSGNSVFPFIAVGYNAFLLVFALLAINAGARSRLAEPALTLERVV